MKMSGKRRSAKIIAAEILANVDRYYGGGSYGEFTREQRRLWDLASDTEVHSMILATLRRRSEGKSEDSEKYGPGTSAATDAALKDRVKSLTRGRRKK